MNLDPQVLSGAGIVMLIGLGIVFIALIVIIALLYLQAAAFKSAGPLRPRFRRPLRRTRTRRSPPSSPRPWP